MSLDDPFYKNIEENLKLKSSLYENIDFDGDVHETAIAVCHYLLAYYVGSLERRLRLSMDFLDDMLFELYAERINPFDSQASKLYTVFVVSRHQVFPDFLEHVSEINRSRPISYKEITWN